MVNGYSPQPIISRFDATAPTSSSQHTSTLSLAGLQRSHSGTTISGWQGRVDGVSNSYQPGKITVTFPMGQPVTQTHASLQPFSAL